MKRRAVRGTPAVAPYPPAWALEVRARQTRLMRQPHQKRDGTVIWPRRFAQRRYRSFAPRSPRGQRTGQHCPPSPEVLPLYRNFTSRRWFFSTAAAARFSFGDPTPADSLELSAPDSRAYTSLCRNWASRRSEPSDWINTGAGPEFPPPKFGLHVNGQSKRVPTAPSMAVERSRVDGLDTGRGRATQP